MQWYREIQEDPKSRYVQSYFIQQMEDSDEEDQKKGQESEDSDGEKNSLFVSKRISTLALDD